MTASNQYQCNICELDQLYGLFSGHLLNSDSPPQLMLKFFSELKHPIQTDHYFDIANRLFTVVMLLYNVYVLYSSMEEWHSRMGEFKLKSTINKIN